MKKIIFISFLGCLFLVGCQKKDASTDGKTELLFWHSMVSSSVPALDTLVSDFEKEFPDIRINAQYVPGGDAHIQKLVTAIQSKTAPDISWLHADYLEDLVTSDAIYKMSHFMKGPDGLSKEDLDDIYPSLIVYASWRDTLYSMPMEATNLGLLYNKRLFREAGLDPNSPPQGWDDLHEYAKKLTKDNNNDGKYDQIGFFIPHFAAGGPLESWMTWQWMPFLWQAGGFLIEKDQSAVLYNSEAGVSALSLWNKIYKDLRLDLWTTDFDVFFASERLAMAMDGPWNLPRYKDLLKNLDWAVAPLPKGPEKQATVVGGEYLAIFKQSRHPDKAWQFLKWMIRPDVQAKWAMLSGYLPVREAVHDIPEFKAHLEKHPNYKVFVDQMRVGQAQRSIDYYSLEITRHMAEAIERVLVGGIDPKVALDESAQKSNVLLKSVNQE